MAGNHDYVALDWVKGEIDSTLQQAQTALEDYVGNPDDSAKLRFCLNYIHQVHGTLQMVEFYGAALLAEEMEQLTQALLQKEVAHPEEAIETLMRGILQLPNYLNRLQTSQRDLPVVLLPILNDLRASRGASLLSDTSLFTPDLRILQTQAPASARTRLQSDKAIGQLRKLRQMYQFALAGVIRESDLEANYGYMLKVFQRLSALCQATAHFQLWRLAQAMVEGLQQHQIELSSATKNVLRSLDSQLKHMISEHQDVLVQKVPEDLSKHLLYYLARAKGSSAELEKIRQDYRLDQALPSDAEVDEERQRMAGPDAGAISSVVDALNEELARVKDQLDLFVRGEFKNSSELEELIPGLQQVSNTMAVLGLGLPRKVIDEQINLIQNLSANPEIPEDNVLMDIAGALLYVEATLSGFGDEERGRSQRDAKPEEASLIPQEQIAAAHEAVIREARNGLEQAKTDIVEYIASHWEKSEIETVPRLLHTVRGGLQIIPLDRAADLLDAAARYIQERLLDSDEAPDWAHLDTLADAITSIEYYLERLGEGSQDNELILQVAEQSLGQLGYPVAGGASVEAPLVQEMAPPSTAPETSRDKETDKDLIDDEIVEIFVEEANEVLGTIQQHFPTFETNPDDGNALTEIRRAFHTLKGSGRLVGAEDLAGLAWSVENMLNRVIEGSVTPNLEMFELLSAVNNKLPGLIESFRAGQDAEDVSGLVEKAEAIARRQQKPAEDSEPEQDETAAPVSATEDTEAEEAPLSEEIASETPEQEQPTLASEALKEDSDTPEPVAPAVASSDDDMIDDEIIEIFVEEAQEVLETIHQYLPQFLKNYENKEALTELRRAFHTLKGSGRLVGAERAGELAWSIENLLNRVLDASVGMNPSIGNLIQSVVGILPDLVTEFAERSAPVHDIQPLMDTAHAMAAGKDVDVVTGDPITAATEEALDSPHVKAKSDLDAAHPEYADLEIDPALRDIFVSETESHLLTLDKFIDEVNASSEAKDITDDISRAMHTLKGSANTAGITPIANIVVPVEKFVKEARAHGVPVDSQIAELLARTAGYVRTGLRQVSSEPLKPIEGTEKLLSDLDALTGTYLSAEADSERPRLGGKPDPQLINLFLTEGVDILLDAERILNEWKAEPEMTMEVDSLVSELTTLAHGAEVAGLDHIAELAGTLEGLYEKAMVKGPGDQHFFDVATRAQDALISMMDQVAAGLATSSHAGLIAELEALITELDSLETLSDNVDENAEDEEIPTLEMDAPAAAEQETESASSSLLDPELAEIFLEEANELIHSSGESLQQWSQQLDDINAVQSLQRDLHTLKGGARLSGITPVGDLSHELESLFEAIVDGRMSADEEACNLALLAHDTLANMVDAVSSQRPCTAAPELIEALQNYLQAQLSGTQNDVEEDADKTTADAPPATAETLVEPPREITSSHLDDLALDPEMVEIFLEEAEDIIQRTSETLHTWSNNLDDNGLLAELQRDLHTLKGGARMAEISPIGDLAHELETLFERMTEGRLQPHTGMVSLVMECHDRLAHMIDAVSGAEPIPVAEDLIPRIKQMADPDSAPPDPELTEEDLEAIEVSKDLATAPEEASKDEVEDETASDEGATAKAEERADALPSWQEPDISQIENEIYELSELDPELVEMFLEEANELVDATAEHLQSWLSSIDDLNLVKALQRDLHTLKGGARLAEIRPIGDLAHELETLFEGIVDGQLSADTSLSGLMLECHDRLAEMVEAVSDQRPVAAANDLILRVNAYYQQHATDAGDTSDALQDIRQEQQSLQEMAGETSEAELQQIFLDESRDIMEVAYDSFARWKDRPDYSAPVSELARDLATLNGGAKLAHIDSVSELAEAVTNRLGSLSENQQVSDELIALVERSLRYLTRLLDQIEEGEEPAVPKELIHELAAADSGELVEEASLAIDVDPEILEVFVEEADELQSQLEAELADWARDPRNPDHADNMARALHTLKGGARLASLSDIGDLAQELESIVKDAHQQKQEFGNSVRGEVETLFNRMKSELDKVRSFWKQQNTPEASKSATADMRPSDKTGPVPEEDNAATTAEKMVELQRQQPTPAAAPATPTPQAAKAAPRQAAAETIRVSAPLLDNLVNLAGETSITRGLLEQQISDFTYTLEEMQATIDRLREQLRRMDMETEAQVLFRMEKEGVPEYEDFDPLEMDRYSGIQQLSRALSESASDLTDLRETMLNKSRDAETLLLQQSRINTELQEGLMKTRMVPFTSTVPRLRRIVRQITSELGKKVNFEVYNPEGELDRTVLERMVAPLEHMLRNAVDHGIEMPEARKAAGKSETGRIELSVGREGGDVVLVLADDGGGINVDAVRKKAIKQGLLDEGTAISDHEVLQFVFQAGFSTAEKVTQISGRGVGMDVVASEIKQLGGRVSIDSIPGRGTRFIVHLPFTVSVNRALMVNTGEDYFAIPLNTIEGIVRVSTFELEEYYKPDAPLYEYAGQKYRLQYLGRLLNSEHHPKLQGQTLPLPVILVRGAGDTPLALQVDSLMGSREIVVKALGPQFSNVRGVSGATILGDGSVVVILDLPALMRSDISTYISQPEEETVVEEASRGSRPPRVMVVDDSVTVRKVTSRLLERNGMEVFLAKDGVDAIALLQDHKPDIMLLDIEMPRMDGFEVASLVRHDERLQDVPIIMITSRTGAKHRDRAISIGVNEYLGKPFQESILLETIERLIGEN